MTSYAAQKGRAAPVAKAAAPSPSRALTDAEQQRVAETRAAVVGHMPEAVQFIKDLHAEGMIDGWRNVVRCSLLDDAGHE